MDDRIELLQAYRSLGLEPGADLAAVEARYREQVMALHPDRHSARTQDSDATAALTALSAARRRLRDHQRRFGRLPRAEELQPGPASPAIRTPRRQLSLQPRTRPHRALLVVALTAFGIWAAMEFVRPKPPPPAPAAGAGIIEAAHEDLPTAERPRIRLGSSEEEVLSIAGQPSYARDDVWEYGPSRIEFDAGRVSGWYSSPLAPLPVDEHRPLGVRDPLDTR